MLLFGIYGHEKLGFTPCFGKMEGKNAQNEGILPQKVGESDWKGRLSKSRAGAAGDRRGFAWTSRKSGKVVRGRKKQMYNYEKYGTM